MSTVISAALLIAGLGVIVASCVGMALLDDPLDRVHLVTPASTVGVIATCAAIVVHSGLDASGTAAVLTAVVVSLSSQFVSQATARSIAVRRLDDQRNEETPW